MGRGEGHPVTAAGGLDPQGDRQWVGRLASAKRARFDEELDRLGRIPLLIVDEVGYIPFDPEAAALFFALVSSRYERCSVIVNSTISGVEAKSSCIVQGG